MGLFNSLFGRKRRTQVRKPTFTAELRPDEPFVAIGDIHGCADALTSLIGSVDIELPDVPIICVGDYVDRGEQSAQVLRLLFEHSQNRGDAFHCLFGNHEEMMIKFLDNPEKHGSRWLRYGGLQTLASFGVGHSGNASLEKTRDALAAKMGDALIDWIRTLPLVWATGNVAVVHAATDPYLPIPDQQANTLLWGHPDFESMPRADGNWVLHGHTIVDQPYFGKGRISIDTGAYATGRLTAAYVTTGGVSFKSV